MQYAGGISLSLNTTSVEQSLPIADGAIIASKPEFLASLAIICVKEKSDGSISWSVERCSFLRKEILVKSRHPVKFTLNVPIN